MARPEEPIEHGTYSGYQKHHKRAVPVCEPCRVAHVEYVRALRAMQRRAGLDPLATQKRQQLLRNRALSRLAEMFPEEYRLLYKEEAMKP